MEEVKGNVETIEAEDMRSLHIFMTGNMDQCRAIAKFLINDNVFISYMPYLPSEEKAHERLKESLIIGTLQRKNRKKSGSSGFRNKKKKYQPASEGVSYSKVQRIKEMLESNFNVHNRLFGDISDSNSSSIPDTHMKNLKIVKSFFELEAAVSFHGPLNACFLLNDVTTLLSPSNNGFWWDFNQFLKKEGQSNNCFVVFNQILPGLSNLRNMVGFKDVYAIHPLLNPRFFEDTMVLVPINTVLTGQVVAKINSFKKTLTTKSSSAKQFSLTIDYSSENKFKTEMLRNCFCYESCLNVVPLLACLKLKTLSGIECQPEEAVEVSKQASSSLSEVLTTKIVKYYNEKVHKKVDITRAQITESKNEISCLKDNKGINGLLKEITLLDETTVHDEVVEGYVSYLSTVTAYDI